jgi:pullulanase/glycogen debranching enzyme
MSAAAWDAPQSLALMLQLQGAGQGALLLFNPQAEPVCFTLPQGAWRLQLDSADRLGQAGSAATQLLLARVETVAAGALWLAVAESSDAADRRSAMPL